MAGTAEKAAGSRSIGWLDRFSWRRAYRADGPAFVRARTGGFKVEEWYTHGKRHRADGSGQIITCTDGFRSEAWYRENLLDRDDGPATIDTTLSGTVARSGIAKIGWIASAALQSSERAPTATAARNGTVRDLLNRDDGPAVIETRPDGYCREAWYSKGQRDRADGPAVIETQANGTRREEWCSKGKLIKAETPVSLTAIPGVSVLKLALLFDFNR